MRDYFQLIGHALQAQCPAETGSSLLYAEVAEGVIESSVFIDASNEALVFRYASDELEDLVYELWESGQDGVPAKSWAAIEYALVGGKLDIAFTYPEQVMPDEGHIERRQRLVDRRFPGFKVDFSQPE
ncbi:MAG: hypothetical protein DI587_33755 [Variovorax paradoxus]|nr:MAG: hypothetical protein DI583_33755 [Variovorax paradoxus]PZQ02138.1 MAG: hypothetical protein DI587_33755 [Variovorax paradoxus]